MDKPDYYDFLALTNELEKLFEKEQYQIILSELHKIKFFTNRYKIDIVEFNNIIDSQPNNKFLKKEIKVIENNLKRIQF